MTLAELIQALYAGRDEPLPYLNNPQTLPAANRGRPQLDGPMPPQWRQDMSLPRRAFDQAPPPQPQAFAIGPGGVTPEMAGAPALGRPAAITGVSARSSAPGQPAAYQDAAGFLGANPRADRVLGLPYDASAPAPPPWSMPAVDAPTMSAMAPAVFDNMLPVGGVPTGVRSGPPASLQPGDPNPQAGDFDPAAAWTAARQRVADKGPSKAGELYRDFYGADLRDLERRAREDALRARLIASSPRYYGR